jgi:radical SAM-linked protein
MWYHIIGKGCMWVRCFLRFQKEEKVKHISHLDLVRTMQRSIRRAGIPVSFSQGFNPHPIISFASALAVGVTSQGEYMDMTLGKDMDIGELIQSLNQALPEGIRILEGKKVSASLPSLMSVIEKADYIVKFTITDNFTWDTDAWVKAFMEKESIPVEKKGKRGIRQVDIRPHIDYLKATVLEGNTVALRMRISSGSKANIKPEQVVEALFNEKNIKVPDIGLQIHRMDLYAKQKNKLVQPLELDDSIDG